MPEGLHIINPLLAAVIACRTGEQQVYITSKSFLRTVPLGCRTVTVLLPFNTSMPTAFNIVSDLQSDRFAWYQRLSIADSVSWVSYGYVQ